MNDDWVNATLRFCGFRNADEVRRCLRRHAVRVEPMHVDADLIQECRKLGVSIPSEW